MTTKYMLHALVLCAPACIGIMALPARAQVVNYHVALDTSGLGPSGRGPFALDFQFNDGGVPNNNIVTLTQFNYGGGSAAPAPSSLSGGASGNAASTITLADSSFFNELVQTFTAGQSLAFDVSLTTRIDNAPGGTPDEFSFSLLDGSGSDIVTTATNSAFVTIDIDSSTPTVTTAGTPSGMGLFIAAPTATQTSAVPEAGGAFACLIGITGSLAVAGSRRLRSRASRP